MKFGWWQRLRAQSKKFREATAGRRFEERYERRREKMGKVPLWLRIIYVCVGILLLLVGVVFAFLPGPAVLFYAVGLGLLANESRWLARRLDAGERWGRRIWARWRKA